jgi:DNA ligase-1
LPQASSDAVLKVVVQERLLGVSSLRRRLTEVTSRGGEGLMLHRADALYAPGRSALLLKLKLLNDAEARVLGAVPGQGRLGGQMGALRVQTPEGIEFQLGTGFSDAHRREPPAPGTWVTYSFRGRTAYGVPRFASFVRVRDEM